MGKEGSGERVSKVASGSDTYMAERVAVFLTEIRKFGKEAKCFGEMISYFGQMGFLTMAWVAGENTLPPSQDFWPAVSGLHHRGDSYRKRKSKD